MKVLDLFSGIGGFSLGLERAGMETVAFCEIEEYPRKVLAKHWPDIPIYEDVRELTGERLRADGVSPTVITGGFPCQDISVAGKQAGIGEGTRSGLWSEVARLISEIQPRYAIMENVTALISGDSGRWFGRVLGDLAEIGYDCEWHCIPAHFAGLPHNRDRIWIISYPHGQGLEGCQVAGSPQGEWQERAKQFRAMAEGLVRVSDPAGSTGGISYGVRNRIHRLKGLGNAVVPQIPEIIGRAIMEVEQSRA